MVRQSAQRPRLDAPGEYPRPDYLGHPHARNARGFLAYLKKDLMFASVPVVILSGEDSSTERIRLLQEGAEDFIIKPFNPMELKIRIKKILD